MGSQRVGGRRVGGAKDGGRRVGGRRVGGQHFALFFSSSDPLFVFFLQFPEVFRGIAVGPLHVCIIEKVVTTHKFGLSAHLVKPRRPPDHH